MGQATCTGIPVQLQLFLVLKRLQSVYTPSNVREI